MTLKTLKGVGPKRIQMLREKGIEDFNDLINTFPSRYDLRELRHFDDLSEGDAGYFKGTLESDPKVYFIRKNLSRLTFKARVDGRLFSVALFNQHYLSKALFNGCEVVIYAKKELNKKSMTAQKVMLHKSFEEGILPTYKISGISDKIFSNLVHQALDRVSKKSFKDPIPNTFMNQYHYKELYDAYFEIHTPTSKETLRKALERFRYADFLTYQIKVLLTREKRKSMAGAKKAIPDKLLEQVIKSLPFELSDSQKDAVTRIRHDLASNQPMRRMLQGDTGSGKTVVALLAAAIALSSNYQVAFMVPTEILATQQYESAIEMLKSMDKSIGLFTETHQDQALLEALSEGSLDMVVGTHRLFSKKVSYKNLGLVITDEQHRFGVNQRNKLTQKGEVPDILYLSATPIPRTLAQTLFGDMDIAIIERPKSYLDTLKTAVRTFKSERPAFNAIKRRLEKGEQVYVVAPTIEDTETLVGVKSLYKKLTTHFKAHKVLALHGKMKGDLKEKTLKAFKDGTVDILVTTTVIEVGIHVENATLMVVYHGERFGYAQLHQLRGRVGRGSREGACLILAKDSEEALQRLKILETTQDGFALSEIDLNRRGFGDIIGTRQSGLTELYLGKDSQDMVLFKRAFKDAHKIMTMAKEHFDKEASKLIKHLDTFEAVGVD